MGQSGRRKRREKVRWGRAEVTDECKMSRGTKNKDREVDEYGRVRYDGKVCWIGNSLVYDKIPRCTETLDFERKKKLHLLTGSLVRGSMPPVCHSHMWYMTRCKTANCCFVFNFLKESVFHNYSAHQCFGAADESGKLLYSNYKKEKKRKEKTPPDFWTAGAAGFMPKQTFDTAEKYQKKQGVELRYFAFGKRLSLQFVLSNDLLHVVLWNAFG